MGLKAKLTDTSDNLAPIGEYTLQTYKQSDTHPASPASLASTGDAYPPGKVTQLRRARNPNRPAGPDHGPDPMPSEPPIAGGGV